MDWSEQYPQIHRLHFNRNDLKNWKDVANIGKIFPSLRSLVMCGNPLKDIKIEGETELSFPELKAMSLSETEIQSWESVDEIRKLPALEDLRLLSIPVASKEASKETRMLMISRLPHVKKLNGSEVAEGEREDAERFFIRHYMDSEDLPKRYHELVAVHGVVNRLAEVDMSRKECLKLSLFIEEDEFAQIDVNVLVDTRCFKQKIGKKVGMQPTDFRMFYCDQEILEHVGPEEMKIGDKLLSTYRMQDGDKILVQRKFKKS